MVGAVAALPGIVREISLLRADIERANSVRTQGAETHRGNIEYRGRIGLCAIGTADKKAEWLFDRRPWRDRMVQPLVAAGINFVLRSERTLVERLLGALIDERALVPRKWRSVLLAFEKILTNLRANFLQDEADM